MCFGWNDEALFTESLLSFTHLGVGVHEHFCKNISDAPQLSGTENVACLEVRLETQQPFFPITPESTSTVGYYISNILPKKY